MLNIQPQNLPQTEDKKTTVPLINLKASKIPKKELNLNLNSMQ